MKNSIDETQFISRARSFLCENLGLDLSNLGPDEDLISSGLLTSLPLIEFLSFIEAERQTELSDAPDLGQGLTLRIAYGLATQ